MPTSRHPSFGHTIHLEKVDRSLIPYELDTNIDDTHTIWNAFDIDYHIGYLITWDGQRARDTYHGKTVDKDLVERGMTEEETVKCVVNELFPEPVIVTDKEQIQRHKDELDKTE